MEMNKIANIFGLHLGCWVKISRTGEKGKIINVSTSLSIGEGIITIENLFSGMKTKYIKDCKIILKPLSKITDNEMKEFFKTFAIPTNGKKYWFNKSAFGIKLSCKSDFFDLEIAEILWLASKGYDIGIIPDEYKEVEE